MVKFSKELEAQLIPEWKEAFVNYWQLKKQIKRIKNARAAARKHRLIHSDHHFARSIFDPVSTIAKDFSHKFFNNFLNSAADGQIIQVKITKSGDDDSSEEEVNANELCQLFSEEDEVNVFYEKLKEEVDKVNRFYERKESELVERGELLCKQLHTLLHLKFALEDRSNWKISVPPSPFSSRNSDVTEGITLNEVSIDASETEEEWIDGVSVIGAGAGAGRPVKEKKGGKPPHNYKNTGMDLNSAGTVTRKISAVTSTLWEDLVNSPKKSGPGDYLVNGKKIQYAEKTIRGAFIELYRGLGLLKTFSSLNLLAFVKIIKKFDKVSNQHATASHLNEVKRSHFTTSDKVIKLMDEIESMFTSHFTSNDRKKAMKYLRPKQHKDSHMVTFFVGLSTGCFVSLFIVYAILVHLFGILSPTTEVAYMQTIYPVFSVFALLSLHLFMYGCNLYMWKKSRINHNFIFEFHPSTALKYRDAFLICTTFMTSVVGAVVLHLVLISSGFSSRQVDSIPGILFMVSTAMLICPLDIFYRSTRYCFLGVIRNIICSPFCKVVMVDFFMADQLTSQIPLMRHMESTACYFLAGSFMKQQHEICETGKLFNEVAYIISFLPYYWRAMQCARRWFDENDVTHLANMGKYVSAMVAAGARIIYYKQQQPNHIWLGIIVATSFGATVYQLYWDFVKDWGLLNPKSKNLWLRDELVLRNKGFYYVSIALNVVLRVAWLETVIQFRSRDIEKRLIKFLLDSLEVIRRGHWNFYRVENEHLNNVGQFRAVKLVPLPFHDTDSDS